MRERGRHTGDTGGDDNDVGILESRLGAVVLGQVASGLLLSRCVFSRGQSWRVVMATGSTHGNRGDVGQVGSDAGGVDNVVEGELVNEGRELEEEGQRLEDFVSSRYQ